MPKHKKIYPILLILPLLYSTLTTASRFENKKRPSLRESITSFYTVCKNKTKEFTKNHPFLMAACIVSIASCCLSKKMRTIFRRLPQDILDDFREKPVPMTALSILIMSYIFANL